MPNAPHDPTDFASDVEADSRNFGGIQIGDILDEKYEITGRIASGGMGAIYRARHRELGTDVAIKVLHPRYAAEADGMRRFQREARIISSLRHPNILAVYAFGRVSVLVYMAMELVNGESLGHLVRDRGAMPVSEAIPILLQICDAMQFAHDNDVFHRDLKPDNVIIVQQSDGTKSVKVIDFGLAKLLEGQDGQRLTKTGEVLGDPSYMSPEQAQGRTLDRRSDIYSFGCSMYEVLTGERPFVADSPVAVLYKQISDNPALFAQAHHLPQGLETVTFTAMAKDPDERYNSFAEVKDALQQVAANPSIKLKAAQYKRIDTDADRRKRMILGVSCGSALMVALIALALHLTRFQSWGVPPTVEMSVFDEPEKHAQTYMPSTPTGLLSMATDLYRSRQYDLAVKLLREADAVYKRNPRLYKDLRQALRIKVEMAACLRQLNQPETEKTILEEALPIATSIDSYEHARVLLYLAFNAEKRSKAKESLEYATKAVALCEPIDEGQLSTKIGRHRLALSVWRQVAAAHTFLEDRPKADKAWARALEHAKFMEAAGYPDDFTWYNYAGYLAAGRRNAEAWKVTDDVMRSGWYLQRTSMDNWHRALLHVLRGDIAGHLKRYKQSETEYLRALSFVRESAGEHRLLLLEIHYKRALALYADGKPAEGDAAYLTAEKIPVPGLAVAKYVQRLRDACKTARMKYVTR